MTLLTAAPLVSYWTQYTLEQERIERRLVDLGVRLRPRTTLASIAADHVMTESVVNGAVEQLGRACVLLVADRTPRTDLHEALSVAKDEGALDSVRLIGDAEAPGLITQAVFSGHRAARQFGEDVDPDGVEFLREG